MQDWNYMVIIVLFVGQWWISGRESAKDLTPHGATLVPVSDDNGRHLEIALQSWTTFPRLLSDE